MNHFDFKLYSEIQKTKKPSEVFLGYIKKNWEYSFVDYTADCQESVPLNVFDKAICGLLDIESQLSFTQLGDILSLNIVDDEDSGKYCDLAEKELLEKAIEEMIEYGMIARSMFDSSYYRITDTGRDYIKNNRKLKTHDNVSFRLYFDWTTGLHSEAKKIFENLNDFNIVSRECKPCMTDESLLMSFMTEQQPSIYNTEGNSFSNLNIVKAQNVEFTIHIGLLYDFINRSYRLYAVNHNSNIAKYLNRCIEFNESLFNDLLKDSLSYYTISRAQISQEQAIYENSTIKLISEIENLSSKDAQQHINIFNEKKDLMENEYFWANIDTLIKSENNKVYFFVEYLTDPLLEIIIKNAKNQQNKYYYVLYNKADDEIEYLIGNVFLMQHNVQNIPIVCYCDSNLAFEKTKYIHSIGSISYESNMVLRNNAISFNIDSIEQLFAVKILPQAIRFVDGELLPRNFENNIESIERLDWYIGIIEQFSKWYEILGVSDKVNSIKSKQSLILSRIKKEHEKSLNFEVHDILKNYDFTKIRKLDKLLFVRNEIGNIEAECLEEYKEVRSALSVIYNLLDERERFIKDMLMAKIFVFDTNVFLDDPRILSKVKYQDHVILAARVSEELNKHKNNKDATIAQNAQYAIRQIGIERRKENTHLQFERANFDFLPLEFSKRDADNMILAVALNHKNDNICLVTSDEGLIQKALTVEIPCFSLADFYKFIEHREDERKKDIEKSKQNRDSKKEINKRNRR